MMAWVKNNFTVGGIVTILVIIVTVSGAAYVVKDDVADNTVAFGKHTNDGHPGVVISRIDKQEVQIKQLDKGLVKKLDTSVFEAYQVSQKDLDNQFQKQLFIQLDRMETRLEAK